MRLLRLSVVSTLMLSVFATFAAAEDWSFTLKFKSSLHKEPFSGRVYVIFSRMRPEPRLGPNWFSPEQFVSQEVTDWKPDTPLTISSDKTDGQLSYPQPLSKLQLAGYRAQAVVRFNPWDREIGTGAGNGFSQVITITQAGAQPELLVEQSVPEPKFQETEWTKLLSVRSKLLSDFYGRDVHQNAAVILPQSYYREPERRFPVILQIPGFGGDHFDGVRKEPIPESNPGGVEFIRVMLDPSCPLGHHVFADSANNGPRGRTLIEEFIPELDQKFRTAGTPAGRFVTGHSSGGWSSLWLQVTYPETFGGVWSTSPDPVDFRDFQRINLYREGENMYADPNGQARPLARVQGRVMLWYRGFADMEWTLGPGGQLHSFEAVFSPRGADGKPQLVWDRETGVINTTVAKTWEKYDIRLVLERNWKDLEPKLRGKLRVHMGDQDTFYLEGATMLLKKSLEDLKSDAVIEIHPGRDHSNILSQQFISRIRGEMATKFLEANK